MRSALSSHAFDKRSPRPPLWSSVLHSLCSCLAVKAARGMSRQSRRAQVEFTVRERELPPIVGFCVRLDSSLPGAALPQGDVDALCAEALAAAAAPARTSASVYLEFLPRLRQLAAAHLDSPVRCFRTLESLKPTFLVCLPVRDQPCRECQCPL